MSSKKSGDIINAIKTTVVGSKKLFISSTTKKKKITFTNNTKDAIREIISGLFLRKKKKLFAILVRGRENIPHKENSKISIKYNVEKEKREQTLNAISQFLGEFKNLFF